MQVIGLDLSLTNTGVAVLGHDSTKLFRVSSKTCEDTIPARLERFYGMLDEVEAEVAPGDLVVIEQPAFSRTTGKHHDRSGLWWMMAHELHCHGARLVEVPPSTLKKYVTGKGNAGKTEVQASLIRRMLPLAPDLVIHDDNEADALGLALMGARHLGHPVDGDLPKANLAAMQAVRWGR